MNDNPYADWSTKALLEDRNELKRILATDMDDIREQLRLAELELRRRGNGRIRPRIPFSEGGNQTDGDERVVTPCGNT